MSYDFVGLENLPNVYVEKIALSNNDQNTFKVDVSILMIDELFDGFFVWSDDDLIYDYLKVAVIATSNAALISDLTSGAITGLPSQIRRSRSYMVGTKIVETSAKQSTRKQDSDTRRYTSKVSLVAPVSTSTMTLFVFSYVDAKELEKALRITLTGPLSYYCGSISSENVIVDGETEKTTYVYETTSGDTWSGPVHQNVNSRWMGGSFHLNRTHPLLTRRVVFNSKIIDKRKGIFSLLVGLGSQQKPLFSELSTSFNEQADLIGLFSMDFRTLILTKTKYGRKMFNVSKGFFEEFARSIVINSLEVRRQQVKFSASTNSLGTRKYNQNLIGSYKTIDATIERQFALVNTDKLSQIYIVADPLIKTYQFLDDEMSERTRGEFRYEVITTFMDNSKEYLQNIMFQMETFISELKTQSERLFRFRNYDRQNDRLKEESQVPEIFSQAIENYYKNLATFVEMNDEKRQELITAKKAAFTKGNYTNRESENFMADYYALVTKMRRRFDLQKTSVRLTSKSRPSKIITPGMISVSSIFENRVKFDPVEASYNYLGVQSNKGIVSLSKDDYLKRSNKEVSRFFDTSRSTTSADLADLDSDDVVAIKDMSVAKLSFFSPLGFKFKSQTKDLTSLQDLDMDGVSINFISHMTEKQEKQTFSSAAVRKSSKPQTKNPKMKSRKPMKKRRFGRVKFNFKRTPFKITNLQVEDHLEVSKYLGQNSEMADVETKLDQPPIAPQTAQVQTKLAITNGLSVKREKISFDLSTKNNNFETFKSSPKYTPERLKMMPVSIKALFNSRSTAAKNNILDAESDIMKDPETKVATEMIFHATQKVQFFSGFKTDSNGMPDVSQPNWEDITPIALESNPRLVCRMQYAQIPELGINPAEEFRLLAQNSTFVISDQPITNILIPNTLDQETIDLATELPEIDEVVFASSNYVKQSNSRRAQAIASSTPLQTGGSSNGQNSRY